MSTPQVIKLIKENGYLAFFVLLVWVIATPSFQYVEYAVSNIEFPGSFEDWTVKGSVSNAKVMDETVSVHPVREKRTFLSRFFPLFASDGANHFIRVTGDVKGTVVNESLLGGVSSKKNSATLLIVRFEDNDRKQVRVHRLAEFESLPIDRTYTAVYSVPDIALGVSVGLLLRDYSASYELHGLTIERVKYSVPYIVSALLMLIAGLILIMRVAVNRVKENRTTMLLTVMIVSMLLVGVLLSGQQLQDITKWVYGMLSISFDENKRLNLGTNQKLGHLFGFIVLTVVVLSLVNRSRINILVKIGLFAFLTEAVQRHSVERSPSFADISIDFLGILIGGCIWWMIHMRRKHELA